MQSLFSCLFALLLYAGGIYTVMCITARLLWITQQENTAREENTDAVYVFVKMPSDKQLNKVREWLLYAVTKAEKELGGGTGQIKLRYVYDMFVARFTWLARVISFEAFSMMADEALERMKKMLESNKAMQTLVSGEAGETVEKDM